MTEDFVYHLADDQKRLLIDALYAAWERWELDAEGDILVMQTLYALDDVTSVELREFTAERLAEDEDDE